MHRIPDAITYSTAHCRLGTLLLARNHDGICALFLGDKHEELTHALTQRFPTTTCHEDPDALKQEIAAVQQHLANPEQATHIKLAPCGTSFQQKVWAGLQQIPAGETVTYSELAHRIGKPDAVRAVASACGANPISVLIPCHRVIRKDGELGGYRWGLARKQQLLNQEKAIKRQQLIVQ